MWYIGIGHMYDLEGEYMKISSWCGPTYPIWYSEIGQKGRI